MVKHSRIDTLTSAEDFEQTRKTGCGFVCQIFTASICSLLGIIVLVFSYLVLRSDNLQMPQYWRPYSPMYNKSFPTTLLGCAATNTASAIIQIISSLMLLFQDLTGKIWKWLNFTVLMITVMSIVLLAREDYSDIPSYASFFNTLIANCVICITLLAWNVFCCIK